MKIVAVVDVHPIGEVRGRGLFARITKKTGAGHFDLPISREQAGVLLANIEPLIDPPSAQSEEDFSDFVSNTFGEELMDMKLSSGVEEYDFDDEDDL